MTILKPYGEAFFRQLQRLHPKAPDCSTEEEVEDLRESVDQEVKLAELSGDEAHIVKLLKYRSGIKVAESLNDEGTVPQEPSE